MRLFSRICRAILIVQVHQLQPEFHRVINLLHRFAVLYYKPRPQCPVPPDDLPQTPLKSRHIQISVQFARQYHIVETAARLQTVQKPEPLLGPGKRQSLVSFRRWYLPDLCVNALFLEQKTQQFPFFFCLIFFQLNSFRGHFCNSNFLMGFSSDREISSQFARSLSTVTCPYMSHSGTKCKIPVVYEEAIIT